MKSIIFQRRSIRKFKSGSISPTKIEKLISAGMAAPSARNKKPWHFIVIDKRDILDQLAVVHPYAKMMKEATLAILVAGDLKLDDNIDYLVQNCSAATQNILLIATELGLGSVWLGVYPRDQRVKDISELLHIPEHVIPISLIAIGYPNEEKPPNGGIEPNKLHYNQFH